MGREQQIHSSVINECSSDHIISISTPVPGLWGSAGPPSGGRSLVAALSLKQCQGSHVRLGHVTRPLTARLAPREVHMFYLSVYGAALLALHDGSELKLAVVAWCIMGASNLTKQLPYRHQ